MTHRAYDSIVQTLRTTTTTKSRRPAYTKKSSLYLSSFDRKPSVSSLVTRRPMRMSVARTSTPAASEMRMLTTVQIATAMKILCDMST